jgi:uncharacterized protein (DUF2147 family)
LFITLSLYAGSLYAQGNPEAIVGVWVSENKKLKVELYNVNNKYFGKIVWQYEKIDPETGKPKLDKENPDESKRNRPIMGLQVLKDFVYKDGYWQNGYVYNSQNGKTYACEIWLDGKDVLVLRGYWGIVYHTETWTREK